MLLFLAGHYRDGSLCVYWNCISRKYEPLRSCCYCHCYAAIATPTSSFATIATEIAYADANVARVALLTVFEVICCYYCNCYDANCYYERAINSTTNRYGATATASEFCYNYYSERFL